MPLHVKVETPQTSQIQIEPGNYSKSLGQNHMGLICDYSFGITFESGDQHFGDPQKDTFLHRKQQELMLRMFFDA